MPEIDPVVLKLKIEVDEYLREARRATKLIDQQLGMQEARVEMLERQMRRSSGSIATSLKGLAGTLATAFTGRELVGLLDSFTRYENALKVAGLEGRNLKQVQEELFTVAQRNGVALEAVGTLYGRAAQSADTLGASQADLLRFTEAVSASLRITGTTTQEASGALLQLGQALGSPRVQAEEFNSIIDTMRPLLKEAAKEIDGTGGTLDGLIRKLKDTSGPGVSNIELFNGITAALERLEDQAGKTSLTVSAGFTNLTSALTKYFGEADKANGVSAALGAALDALARNIDILIPALAIVATTVGTKMVGSAIAGTAAYKTFSGVLLGTTAATQGLTVASNALAKSLPFLAISAVVTALGYMAVESGRASAEMAALDAEIASTKNEADAMEARLKAAGIETDNLGLAAQTARGDMLDLTGGMETARQKAAELGDQAVQTAKQLLQMRLQEVLGDRQRITNARNRRSDSIRSQTRTGDALATSGDRTFRAVEDQTLQRLAQLENDLRRQIAFYDAGGAAALSGGAAPRPVAASSTSTGKKTGSDGRRDALAQARREAQARAAFASELEQLNADELAARAELTGSIEDRLAADLARLEADTRGFARQVALDEELDASQREKLVAERAEVDALRRKALIRDAEIARLEEANAIASELSRAEEGYLRSQLQLVDDREERARLELAILGIQYEQERAELETLKKTLELNGAKQTEIDAVNRRIALLDASTANDRKAVDRANESPLERYNRMLDKSDGQLRDEAEQLIVDEIENVRRGIREAITDQLGIDDPIISGLLDLLLEQVLLKPLAQALQGAQGSGGGLGGLLSGIGSIFGGFRATGGPVSAGQAYVVGERGRELFVPQVSGSIIPNSRLSMGGAAGNGVSVVRLELSGDLDARIEKVSGPVAIEVTRQAAPQIVDAAANETIRRASRPRI